MEANIYDKYHVTRDGEIFNVKTGHKLKPWISQETGYEMVSLCHDGIATKHTVHYLVATIYVPNDSEENTVVDHIDGNKRNNRAENLEWVTMLENAIRAVELGLIKSGEDCDWSLFTNEQVHEICRYLEQGLSNVEILRKMGFPNDNRHKSLITRVRTGKHWKKISSQYSFSRIPTLRKYSDAYIIRICEHLNTGLRPREIANIFGICTEKEWQSFRKLIRNITNKSCYKDISDVYLKLT